MFIPYFSIFLLSLGITSNTVENKNKCGYGQIVNKREERVRLQSRLFRYNKYNIILYADDILLLAPTITALQKLLHACEHERYLIDMAINFKKCSCLRVGQRCDVVCANIASCDGQIIQWETELKYLGVHIVNSRGFKCSLTSAKCSFYRAANAVFGKIGGRSSEDVILQLIRSRCMPALLYGLEACSVRPSDNNSLDFVINRFFMKLFKTNRACK